MAETWTVEIKQENEIINGEIMSAALPYTLPVATDTVLGGVMPEKKSEVMNKVVGVDEQGRLWTENSEQDLTGYATEEYVSQVIEKIELMPGPAGPTGPKGDDGAPGPQGAQGEKGDSGVYIGAEEPTDESVNVWIDPNGEAIDLPSGGGGGSQNFSVVLTSDAAYRQITVPLPVNLGKALIFNVHVTFPSVETEFTLVGVFGKNFMQLETIPVNSKEVGLNLYAVRHTENIYNSGSTIAKDYTYAARPVLDLAGWLTRSYMDNTLSIYANTDGVELPAGTKIEVWGICE